MKNILLSAVIISVLTISFCSQKPDKYTLYKKDSFQLKEDSSNEIKIGQRFYVELTSNESTGYTWQYSCSASSVEYLSDKIFCVKNCDLSGAPNQRIWIFTGKSAGTAELTFKYFRSWEDESTAVDTVVYKIVIK